MQHHNIVVVLHQQVLLDYFKKGIFPELSSIRVSGPEFLGLPETLLLSYSTDGEVRKSLNAIESSCYNRVPTRSVFDLSKCSVYT